MVQAEADAVAFPTTEQDYQGNNRAVTGTVRVTLGSGQFTDLITGSHKPRNAVFFSSTLFEYQLILLLSVDVNVFHCKNHGLRRRLWKPGMNFGHHARTFNLFLHEDDHPSCYEQCRLRWSRPLEFLP